MSFEAKAHSRGGAAALGKIEEDNQAREVREEGGVKSSSAQKTGAAEAYAEDTT